MAYTAELMQGGTRWVPICKTLDRNVAVRECVRHEFHGYIARIRTEEADAETFTPYGPSDIPIR